MDWRANSRWAWIYGALTRVETVLAATLLVLMVVLIFTGGVARMMRHPLNWTTDFATCFFAWGAFLAADIAWRKDALMHVDIVVRWLAGRPRLWLSVINHVLISAFLAYLVYAGVQLAIVSSARSFQGVPWISYSWVTMSLPVGATLLLISTLIRLDRLRRGDDAAAATPKGNG